MVVKKIGKSKEERTMKKMMTNMKTLVALLMAGAAVTSCSSDDTIADQPVQQPVGPQVYTMTVEATKGGDATTRALADGGTTLTATWATTENVYVKKVDTWATGSLKPQADGATATLKGELSGVTIAANDVLTLQFPRSGALDYTGQVGTLEDIAAKYDYATATVTVKSVSGGDIIPEAATTTFQHQQAIVRFTLKNSDGTALPSNPTAFTMTDGTSTVELTSIPAGTYTTNGAGVLYVAFPASNGSADITLTATVGSDTYTLTTSSSKTFNIGNFYRVTAKMAKQASVPENALSGQFTVGMDGSTPKKVYFSKGNLYYDANATTKWYFATNQWDYIGTATSYPMDHFTWGNIDTPTYNGTSYYTENANLNGDTDWGSRMGTGWYTLSKDEWTYVFGTNSGDKRSGATVGTTANARYTEATINTDGTGVNGVILFPDGATFAADDATWGTINAGSAWGTKCTTAQWTALEAKGCVFLPAAGYRNGASVNDVGSYGYYWSSTANGTDGAYGVYFSSGDVYPAYDNGRYDGFSVRLVRPVE